MKKTTNKRSIGIAIALIILLLGGSGIGLGVYYGLYHNQQSHSEVPNPPPSPSDKSLITLVNEQIADIKPLESHLTEAEFQSITKNNILKKIRIPGISESQIQQLTVDSFDNSTLGIIQFTVTHNGETSKRITVR